ncbi:PREDICTED: leucine-rich repeat-containing protein 74B-like isoform X2 [Branchiostoma belcheri]|uniref:Leucine-rich repeat-containing protein 74B-like isoform X2 n=1 Tax=Branchiostoma belcheri TaxID=7741 RepID=A0A6P4YDY2_BRABE|nr:PREDICTED: leucine-rich repeat-containing protein 74B-like isoform X2 [Branchiostoma belcheri]
MADVEKENLKNLEEKQKSRPGTGSQGKVSKPPSAGSGPASRPHSRTSPAPSRKSVSRNGSARSSAKGRPGSKISNMSGDVSDQSDNEDTRSKTTMEEGDGEGSDGYDTDLEIEDKRIEYDSTGRTTYKEACKQIGVVPVSYFLRHMQDSELVMMHHGLGPLGAKAIATSLVTNTTILKLNLRDNWLEAQGGKYIAEMLVENCYIHDLDLSYNKIGNDGAEPIAEMLQDNSTLDRVLLSGNGFGDKAAEAFAEAIMSNQKMEEMDLSHNEFGEVSGGLLGPAIAENSQMKVLDLSWNHLRRKGALAVSEGIRDNITITHLDLSWNGFGDDGAEAIGDALKSNKTLEFLDMSNNRISTEGAVLLAKGLIENDTLRVLKMGKNPMQSAGCYGVLKGISQNEKSAIQELDFSDILVNDDFDELLKQVKEMLPALLVKTAERVHGRGGAAKDFKKAKPRADPMTKLKQYVEKNNLRLVDLFNQFDKDKSMSVTREEFAQGIEATGIDLSPDELNRLLDTLDKDGDGEIEYGELVFGAQAHQEQERKMAKTIAQDVLTALRMHIEKRGLRMWDVFRAMDEDGSMTVSREEFRVGIRNTGIELEDEELDVLIDYLDKDGDGDIDYEELVEGAEESAQETEDEAGGGDDGGGEEDGEDEEEDA